MHKLTGISSTNETFNPIEQVRLSRSLGSTANPVALHEIETQVPAGTHETAENAFSLLWAKKNSLGTPVLEIPISLSVGIGQVFGEPTLQIVEDPFFIARDCSS